ncbi:MAG: phospholipase [Deltaproteobacteria bacterium]|nr:phospholipase [Deltaproteobacteria bacterium]
MFGRILKPGRNCRDISEINKAGLLVDGHDYYRAFYHAALKAQSHIFISGWQFDSQVTLLRGDNLSEAKGEIRFLSFLNQLCARNPKLKIYILAWDFSIIFFLEREWMQEWVFNWSSGDRLFFRFDNRHPIGASQHQKFVVIDGALAFLGGLDICAGRWDERSHMPRNPDRVNPDGLAYEPYHDVQSYLTGPIVAELTETFKERWRNCTGEELKPPPPLEGDYILENIGIPISAKKAALSRTQASSLVPLQNSISEIRNLYVDAIHKAKHLIYIENQYFSSYAIYRALAYRMENRTKPKLEIIIILPKRPHGFLEEISLGVPQTKMLESLMEIARRTGNKLGVYYPAGSLEDGSEIPVYIHSKVMLIDDKFLTMGSANTTNRSLGLDSELNVSWEAPLRTNFRMIRSLRRLRADLLSEHTGIKDEEGLKQLEAKEGIVEFLNRKANNPFYRHRLHDFGPSYNAELLSSLKLDNLILDPEKPIIEENLFEILSPSSSLFVTGITILKKWFMSKNSGYL